MVIIKIKNWEKYNPASTKTRSWLRLNSNLTRRPIWDELDSDGLKVFIYMLCQASESDPSGSFHCSSRAASRRCTVSEKSVNRAIEILKQLQVIEVRAPSGLFIGSEQTPPTYDTIRYERTNDTLLPDPPEGGPRRVFDFEAAYQEYPRKEGKSRGLQICKTQIKTEDEYRLLRKAIARYREHVKRTATEPRFVKHFSTFMAFWRDWLDPEVGTAMAGAAAIDWDKIFGKEEEGAV